MDRDIKDINKNGIEKSFAEIEQANLSENYWKVGLVQDLKIPVFQIHFKTLLHSADLLSR